MAISGDVWTVGNRNCASAMAMDMKTWSAPYASSIAMGPCCATVSWCHKGRRGMTLGEVERLDFKISTLRADWLNIIMYIDILGTHFCGCETFVPYWSIIILLLILVHGLAPGDLKTLNLEQHLMLPYAICSKHMHLFIIYFPFSSPTTSEFVWLATFTSTFHFWIMPLGLLWKE